MWTFGDALRRDIGVLQVDGIDHTFRELLLTSTSMPETEVRDRLQSLVQAKIQGAIDAFNAFNHDQTNY